MKIFTHLLAFITGISLAAIFIFHESVETPDGYKRFLRITVYYNPDQQHDIMGGSSAIGLKVFVKTKDKKTVKKAVDWTLDNMLE